MSEVDRLRELAQRCGIALEYDDIWGNRREASPDTLRALLAAMGVLEKPDADPEPVARALDQADRRRPLPPIAVVSTGEPAPTVRVVLPAAALETPLRWSVEEEHGGGRAGEVRPADLPVEGRAGVDGKAVVTVRLSVEGPLPAGYHRLVLRRGDEIIAAMALVAAADPLHRRTSVSAAGPLLRLVAGTGARFVNTGARIWGAPTRRITTPRKSDSAKPESRISCSRFAVSRFRRFVLS